METCAAAPSQWDAWTEDGQYLYLRYRHGEGCVERHPGPDFEDTAQSWDEGLPEVLVAWDDGTGRSRIDLRDFLAAAGLRLAPDAVVG